MCGDDNFSFPVDVWSAGCICAETLTGKALFEDERSQAGLLLRMFRTMGSPRGECGQYFAALPLWSAKFPVFSDGSLAADLIAVPPVAVRQLRSALALSPFDRKTATGMLEVFKAGFVGSDEVHGSVPQGAASTPAASAALVPLCAASTAEASVVRPGAAATAATSTSFGPLGLRWTAEALAGGRDRADGLADSIWTEAGDADARRSGDVVPPPLQLMPVDSQLVSDALSCCPRLW